MAKRKSEFRWVSVPREGAPEADRVDDTWVSGPYATRKQAEKALQEGGGTGTYLLVKVVAPYTVRTRQESVTEVQRAAAPE